MLVSNAGFGKATIMGCSKRAAPFIERLSFLSGKKGTGEQCFSTRFGVEVRFFSEPAGRSRHISKGAKTEGNEVWIDFRRWKRLQQL